jgi:hypothetical protein
MMDAHPPVKLNQPLRRFQVRFEAFAYDFFTIIRSMDQCVAARVAESGLFGRRCRHVVDRSARPARAPFSETGHHFIEIDSMTIWRSENGKLLSNATA